MARRRLDVNPFNSIGSILITVVLIVGLFMLVKGIVSLLYTVAWGLLIAALIVDYKVVLGYGKWLLKLLKENFLMGAGAILLTFIGYPFVFGFLLVKALFYRKVNKMKTEFETQTQGELVDYEEVDEIVEPPLELPRIPREERKVKRDNEYEKLFDEDA